MTRRDEVPALRRVLRAIIPAALRRRVGLRYEVLQQRTTAGAVRLAAAASELLLSLVPTRLRVALRSRLPTIGRLDYAPAQLLLAVENEFEYVYRLHSCRKEPETVQWIEQFVGPHDTVYDIGANVGAYSLIADRVARGTGIVYAFEPSFATFAQLNRNVSLNQCGGRVIPLPVALSDSTRMDEFLYSSVDAGTALHTLRAHAGNGALQPAAYRQTILCFRLDDLVAWFGLRPPNHVKIDVDGGELAILKGGARVLSQPSVRSLLIELGPETDRQSPLEWLEHHGFRIHAEHAHGEGEGATRNCILVRAC